MAGTRKSDQDQSALILMELLPELLLEIVSHLTPETAARFAMTCRGGRNVTYNYKKPSEHTFLYELSVFARDKASAFWENKNIRVKSRQ